MAAIVSLSLVSFTARTPDGPLEIEPGMPGAQGCFPLDRPRAGRVRVEPPGSPASWARSILSPRPPAPARRRAARGG
jgi:hypothetical protein